MIKFNFSYEDIQNYKMDQLEQQYRKLNSRFIVTPATPPTPPTPDDIYEGFYIYYEEDFRELLNTVYSINQGVWECNERIIWEK